MRLDSILQASLPLNQLTTTPVGPTLLVGLGGTGKEVLLRLRRMVVERYRSLDDLPFLRFMHLDTDKNETATEQYDLRRADDPLYPQIKFSNVERIDLSIFGGTGRYVDHLGNYPNIKRWFPAGAKIAALGDLHEGAGQVRMASRLGFFDASNHQKIATRLEQCRRELSDASIMQQAANFGFSFEPKRLRVVVVASLAGGTGSGTFLDTGFLVKRYFKEAERLGILLLPSFFAGYAGSDRVRANGYAALMELNHYTFAHSFMADWTPHETERMGPPPFTNTYLIDGRNEEGLAINSGGGEYDAYRMVAEVLYQDYSMGAFAGMKRATRINLEQYNLNVYTHNFLNDALGRGSNSDTHKTIVGDPFPCRFGSFGLSTISFPTERVQNACASRLATKVLDFWKKTAVEDPLEHLFTKFLADEKVLCAQGQYERRDGGGVIDRNDIEEALMIHDAGSGRTFESFLWQKAQAVRVELEATPNGEKAACLRARRAELDQFFSHEDSEDPEEWGIGIRQLENNMRLFLQRAKDAIEAKAAELSDNPQYGVNYTLSLLQGFKALLRNENFRYMPWFDAQIPQWRDRVQYYANALDQLVLDIGRHESEFLFRSADLHRDYEKLVGDDGDEDRGAFFNHFQARVGKQIAKRGRQICDELDAFLGPDHAGAEGLLGRYYELIGGFELVRQHLQKKETYFTKPEKSELAITLYKDGDVDEWYRTWIGADATTETQTVRAVGSSILTDVFQVDRVTAALEKIQRTPAETIERMIFSKCRNYIVAQKKQPEALGILLSLGERDRADKVAQAYRLSKVWLAPSEQGLEHIGLQPVDAKQRPLLIGLDDRTHPQRVAQFKELVAKAQTSGDSQPQFLGIGEQHRGMIVFYHELAGVPAFYPSSVTAPLGLRAAYNGFAEKEELHTDKNRFQFGDLIPKQPAEGRQFAESVRAFVLARVLGLLDVHSLPADAGQLAFRFSYKRMIDLHVEEVNLGGEANAIDFLYRDRRNEHDSHRRYLIQEIDKRIRLLRDQTKLVVYRLLLDFYMSHVYPPREVTDAIPDMTLTQYSPEHAVLDAASKQLDQMIGSDRERFIRQYGSLTGRELEDRLTYNEYAAILGPLCKSGGKYAARKDDVLVDESAEWREIFCLDITKFEKKEAREIPAPRPAPPVEVPKKFGERPCPACTKPVDQRAIHCTQCKKTFAKMVSCPHCSEPRVPSDLEKCWKCGEKMRIGDPIECAQCFTWTGYEDEYPCPNCGYDLEPEAPAIAPVDSPMIPIQEPVEPPRDRVAVTAVTEPTATAVLTFVQCATCDSNVRVGTICEICDTPLEAR